jgi:AcrR family transcriptional regulator
MIGDGVGPDGPPAGTARREAILESALLTFARFGYRKASMEAVARTARISRPGLYFLFSSKEELFRAAVTHALDGDVAAAEAILNDTSRPLPERLLEAFDRWSGRYIGPLSRDITVVIADNPEILGPVAESAPGRFADLILHAISAEMPEAGRTPTLALAQTLISVSIGIKHQVDERATYLQRLEVAIRLLVR